MKQVGFSLVETLLTIAVAGAAVAFAGAWFASTVEVKAVISQRADVARAADLYWLDRYGYVEGVELNCVLAIRVPDDARNLRCARIAGNGISQETNDSVDTVYDPGNDLHNMGGAIIDLDGFVVAVRRASGCDRDVVVDAATSTNEWIVMGETGDASTYPTTTSHDGWGEWLDEDLRDTWMLVLDPGRKTGELRHEALHDVTMGGYPYDEPGLVWQAPIWRPHASDVLFEDSAWAAFGGSELHAGQRSIIGEEMVRSCLDSFDGRWSTTP